MVAALTAAGQMPTPAAAPAEQPPPPPETPAVAPPAQPEPQPDESAAIRKQEIHLRRQMADERARWQAEQDQATASLKPRLAKLEEWEQRLASAKDDPIGYLQAAGWTETELEPLARIIYAHSPEGAKDPKNKTAALQTKAQREANAELQKMRAELDDFKRAQQEQREQAEVQARIDGYYSTVTKAVTDESPIARARLAAMPDAARERMLAIAERLYVDSGPSDDLRDVPEPAQIIKAYEDERRADLETDLRALPVDALRALLAKLGVDPATVLRPTGTVQPPIAAPAGQPRPSTTLTPNTGSPTPSPPRGRMTRDQLIEETRRLNAIAKT